MFYAAVKPFGNWAAARNRTSTLPQTIKRSIRAAEEKAAKKLIKIVKNHILNQDLGWVPLKPSTVSRKGHDNVYIFSKVYFDSLKFWQKGYTVNIGVPRGVYYPSNLGGEEVWKVAMWMEYGIPKRNLPPRPLWGPSIQEMGGKDGLQDIVKDALQRKLKREGWDINLGNYL